mmetsp:Transcript_11690/g.35546  ORF Transcript_11690/g.35546 Transcript_11690/m.35546 type:complete len:579 (-) Transcript_11690:69-1805(-)
MRRGHGHADGGGDDDGEGGGELHTPTAVEVDVHNVGSDGLDHAVAKGVDPEEHEESGDGHHPHWGLWLLARVGSLLEGLNDGGDRTGGVSGVVGPVREGLQRGHEDEEVLEVVDGVLLILGVHLLGVHLVEVGHGRVGLLARLRDGGDHAGILNLTLRGLDLLLRLDLLPLDDLLLALRVHLLWPRAGQPRPDVVPAVQEPAHEKRDSRGDGEDGKLFQSVLLLGERRLHQDEEEHDVGLRPVQEGDADQRVPLRVAAQLGLDDGVVRGKVRGRADEAREQRGGDPGEDDPPEPPLERPVQAPPSGGGPGGTDCAADDGVSRGHGHPGRAGQQQEDGGREQGGEHGDGVQGHGAVAHAAREAIGAPDLRGSLDGLRDSVPNGHGAGPLHDAPHEAAPPEADGAGPDRGSPRVGRVVGPDSVGHDHANHSAHADDPLEGGRVHKVLVVRGARGVGGLLLLDVLEEFDVAAVVHADLALRHGGRHLLAVAKVKGLDGPRRGGGDLVANGGVALRHRLQNRRGQRDPDQERVSKVPHRCPPHYVRVLLRPTPPHKKSAETGQLDATRSRAPHPSRAHSPGT